MLTILTIALVFAMIGFGVASSVTFSRLVARLNERLPADERISLPGWDPFKYARFEKLYRTLEPDRRHLWRYRMFLAASIACAIGAYLLWQYPQAQAG